jgi:uncharacterized membrane protein
MADDDETLRERFRRNASGIAATTVTGTWLAALLLDFDWWLGFMLFGYIVIVPVVSMLFDEEEAESVHAESESGSVRVERGETAERVDETGDTADALERLRTRYANGDLTDEQFERKLDRLLETETPEDAAEWAERNREVERER